MIQENKLFLDAWKRASNICDGMQNLEQKGRMRKAGAQGQGTEKEIRKTRKKLKK